MITILLQICLSLVFSTLCLVPIINICVNIREVSKNPIPKFENTFEFVDTQKLAREMLKLRPNLFMQ